MSFMYNYKRLEQLCNDLLSEDRGVSAYIDRMSDNPGGTRYVKGWRDDLKQLKHYRWIRNQIAHEPNCSESEMCDSDDIEWIVNFYNRIINQNDPLALYRQATTKPEKPKPVKTLKPVKTTTKSEKPKSTMALKPTVENKQINTEISKQENLKYNPAKNYFDLILFVLILLLLVMLFILLLNFILL